MLNMYNIIPVCLKFGGLVFLGHEMMSFLVLSLVSKTYLFNLYFETVDKSKWFWESDNSKQRTKRKIWIILWKQISLWIRMQTILLVHHARLSKCTNFRETDITLTSKQIQSDTFSSVARFSSRNERMTWN